MPIIALPDSRSPELAPYRDLRGKQTAAQMGLFVAEGHWLVRRLLESNLRVHSVVCEQQHLSILEDVLGDEHVVYLLPDGTVDRLIGFDFHRGVLACGYRPDPVGWQEIATGRSSLRLLVCDQVSDRANLGAVVRNAAAFGVDAIVASNDCGDFFSRRVARVSMGTLFHLPICVSRDLAAELRAMRSDYGVEVFGTVLEREATPLWKIAPPRRWALVVGNEGHGVGNDVLQQCSQRLTIPMHGLTDSLNVATATGVFLYHFCCPSP